MVLSSNPDLGLKFLRTLQLTVSSTTCLLRKRGSPRRGSKCFPEACKDQVSDTIRANHSCEEPQLKVSARAHMIVVTERQYTHHFHLSLQSPLLTFPRV